MGPVLAKEIQPETLVELLGNALEEGYLLSLCHLPVALFFPARMCDAVQEVPLPSGDPEVQNLRGSGAGGQKEPGSLTPRALLC